LFSFTSKGQESNTTEEPGENGANIKRYKYEVGTDVKWIFLHTIINNYPNASHSYSYNNHGMRLFGRINKSKPLPEKYTSRKYAYRFGLRLNGAVTFTNNFDTTLAANLNQYEHLIYRNQNYFSILAETGYEVQKQLRRFQLFYGADMGFSYNFSSYDIYLYNRNNPTAYTKKSEVRRNYYSLAISPLVGIKYFIHSRISISGEARFSLGFYSDNMQDGYYGIISKSSGLNTWTDPLYALNMNYYFNW
jgi:hypothetical protein